MWLASQGAESPTYRQEDFLGFFERHPARFLCFLCELLKTPGVVSNLLEIHEAGRHVHVSCGLNGAGILRVAVAPAEELEVGVLCHSLYHYGVATRCLHAVALHDAAVLLDADRAALAAHRSRDGEGLTAGGSFRILVSAVFGLRP